MHIHLHLTQRRQAPWVRTYAILPHSLAKSLCWVNYLIPENRCTVIGFWELLPGMVHRCPWATINSKAEKIKGSSANLPRTTIFPWIWKVLDMNPYCTWGLFKRKSFFLYCSSLIFKKKKGLERILFHVKPLLREQGLCASHWPGTMDLVLFCWD